MKKSILFSCAFFSLLTACRSSPSQPKQVPQAGLAGSMHSTLQHDPNSISLKNPPTPMPSNKPKDPLFTLTGTVLEVLEHAGLTYAYVKPAQEPAIWVAYVGNPAKIKENITVSVSADLKNFEAKSIHKTFDRILLSNRILTTH